jgi:hypothetical protein
MLKLNLRRPLTPIPKSHASNVQTSDVNVVQSTPTSKNKSKKGKGRNKEDRNNNIQSDNTKSQPVDDKEK